MLVSVIAGPTFEEAERQMMESSEADVLEFRLDLLACDPLPTTKPRLFTFRKEGQGGGRRISEQERFLALQKTLALAPEYCDLEADTEWVSELAKQFPRVRFIGSYHNFKETPADLEALLRSMRRPEFFHYKIAVKANSTLDLLRLMHFAKDRPDLSWISMGPLGQPSRVLAPTTGAKFCYAGLTSEALHQIDLKTLLHTYRFRTISPDSRIYALIGDPIESSIGHLYHNATLPVGCLYVKLRITSDELKPFFSYANLFDGLSVTMPHKSACMRYLDTIDLDAKAIGAVNTIRRGAGCNTDGRGALNAIEKHLSIKNARIALIGAGGAARAILFEALRRGAEVHLYNRTYEKALELAESLGGRAHPLADLPKREFDLAICAIPPCEFELPRAVYAMDIAVANEETPFAKKMKASGSQLISWKEMFTEQAALQQKFWLQRDFTQWIE